MFEVKKFNSGEWDVKLTERLDKFEVHWNWFNEDEKDLMIPLLKADAIKKQYGDVEITLIANYFPYGRQDRVFEVGQAIPFEVIYRTIANYYEDVKCMGLHSRRHFDRTIWSLDLDNKRYDLSYLFSPYFNLVFPDKSASKHFYFDSVYYIYGDKLRTENGIELALYETLTGRPEDIIDNSKTFLICDDICDGGRTFIACANQLKEKYGTDIKIELLVYHGFMTWGIDQLKESGISRIHIINPDSYEYLIKKFPLDTNYFQFKRMN